MQVVLLAERVRAQTSMLKTRKCPMISAFAGDEASYPQVPRRPADIKGTRLRLRNLQAKSEYNNHLVELLPPEQQPEPTAGRIAVALCCGFKSITVKPENTHAAPLKVAPWHGLQYGCVPEWVLLRVLLEKAHHHTDILQRIVGYLKIPLVLHKQVTAVSCSSVHGAGPHQSMHGTLIRDHGSWWISGVGPTKSDFVPRSKIRRQFCEYVQYQLGPTAVRCDTVSMRIPSLPAGPLSVREFHLEVPDSIGDYSCVSANFVTLDTDNVQEFAIVPPIESQFVRVVCTRNAGGPGCNNIGFFDIGFS